VAVAVPVNGQARPVVEVANYGNLAQDYELQLALESLQGSKPAPRAR
jgi:hypothetical protein